VGSAELRGVRDVVTPPADAEALQPRGAHVA
jgi:hypothetical protein